MYIAKHERDMARKTPFQTTGIQVFEETSSFLYYLYESETFWLGENYSTWELESYCKNPVMLYQIRSIQLVQLEEDENNLFIKHQNSQKSHVRMVIDVARIKCLRLKMPCFIIHRLRILTSVSKETLRSILETWIKNEAHWFLILLVFTLTIDLLKLFRGSIALDCFKRHENNKKSLLARDIT